MPTIFKFLATITLLSFASLANAFMTQHQPTTKNVSTSSSGASASSSSLNQKQHQSQSPYQRLTTNSNTLHNTFSHSHQHHHHVQHRRNQRQSIGTIQTNGLFGLGVPELLVIGIAVVFVLGPQKIGEIGRSAGKAATDFRDVPKEFQKGLEEGEIEGRSKNAKPMEEVDSNEK